MEVFSHIRGFFTPITFNNMSFNCGSINWNNSMCCTFMGWKPKKCKNKLMLCFTVLPPDYSRNTDSVHTGIPEKNICFHKHSSSQVKMMVALFTSSRLFYEYMVTAFTLSGQVQWSEITERWGITTCTDPEILLSLSIPDKWVTFFWKHPYFHNLAKWWKSLSHKLIYNIRCFWISNHPGVQKVSIIKKKRTLHTC